MRLLAATLLAAACLVSAAPPAVAGGLGDPGLDDDLVREVAQGVLRWRTEHPRPRERVREAVAAALRRQGEPKAAWFDEYYAQRGQHFSGEVAIDTFTGLITATIRTDVTITGKGHKRIYFLTLLPVTGVKDADGNDVPFEVTTDQGVPLTRISFESHLTDGEKRSFVFAMSGQPDCNGGGPFNVSVCAFTENVAFVAMMMFLPSSLAQDYATYDVRLTVPAGLEVASTGRTVERLPGLDAGHEIHHLVQDFPTDAHSLAVGKYDVSSVPFGAGGIRLYTVKGGGPGTLVPEVLTSVRDILDFYSTAFGAFLFPKMDACEITNDAGAAFGWPALLWIPDGMFYFGAGGGGPWHESQRTALFAHELGHQWFPDMMKNNDHYGAWLSEGFAEYASILFMASVEGEDYATGTFDQYGLMYQYYVPWQLDYGLTSKESVQVEDGWVYQLVTYFKGATVANTIAKVVGMPVFLKAIKKLYADVAGKDAYYDTKRLQEYLEEAHGKPLQWLFDQWVYGTGYPTYTVGVKRVAGEGGKPRVAVRVQRASSVADRKFTMPVKFQLVTDTGDEDHVETVDQDDMTFTFDLPGRLARVRLDPDRTFIRRVVPELAGDADLSGEVDGIDMLYAVWARDGSIGQSPNFIPWLDFNRNGMIDATDVGAVLDNFGRRSDEVQP